MSDNTQDGAPGANRHAGLRTTRRCGRGYVVLREQYCVLWSLLMSRYRSARIRSLGRRVVIASAQRGLTEGYLK